MIISRTPFRVSFFGGGTDYSAWTREHAGAVLATTINKYCYISCRYLPPFFEHRYRGYIHDVYVRDAHRRRGIGRRMVEEILDWLRHRGVNMVELTVAANNDALGFWERLGFHTYMHQMKLELREERGC